MLRKMSAWALFFGIVTPLSAAADDSLVKFKGGIGVIPVSAGVAVAPTLAQTSQPWSQPTIPYIHARTD